MTIVELEEIFTILHTVADHHVQQNAILQLEAIVVRSYDVYQELIVNLSEEQLNLRLTIAQQREIALELLHLVKTEHHNTNKASLLWVIGKLKAEAMLDLLQAYMLESYENLDEEILYQGLIALENGLFETELYESNLPLRDSNSLQKMYESVLNASDERIKKLAENNLVFLNARKKE
jgi:hypothetical protein